ncbi:nuclear receptor coactivator 7 isoform X2 [Latimeria chalumnae]|uniref:nuclear receptor coactivator 7 isoform X2 n=1 Tax=Latimeria chalumnae TaxID=7897 RepID=UPI00313C564D
MEVVEEKKERKSGYFARLKRQRQSKQSAERVSSKSSSTIPAKPRGTQDRAQNSSRAASEGKPATLDKEEEEKKKKKKNGSSPRGEVRRTDPKRCDGPEDNQRKANEKKEKKMIFQKPQGTVKYTVESQDTLNSLALKFNVTPNKLVEINKLFSHTLLPGQTIYVPDHNYYANAVRSSSQSPGSPASPLSSDAEYDKLFDIEDIRKVAKPVTRVLSCTSEEEEEEEPVTVKFIKMNCRYITDGVGVVGGVMIVTPNNIMFDPHKSDPLVIENGCEEYGLICPVEEMVSIALYNDISHMKIKDALPSDLPKDLCPLYRPGEWEDLSSEKDLSPFSKFKAMSKGKRRPKTSCENGNTAHSVAEQPASVDVVLDASHSNPSKPVEPFEHLETESKSADQSTQDLATTCITKGPSVSEESFTLLLSTTAQDKDSELTSLDVGGNTSVGPENHVSSIEEGITSTLEVVKDTKCIHLEANVDENPIDSVKSNHEQNYKATLAYKAQRSSSLQEPSPVKVSDLRSNSVPALNVKEEHSSEQVQGIQTSDSGIGEDAEEMNKAVINQKLSALIMNGGKHPCSPPLDKEQDNEEEVKLQFLKKIQGPIEDMLPSKEERSKKPPMFLCIKVGKPMKKTFASQSSVMMQQYAKKGKKPEYWFAVPQERVDHLYAFFVQWSPEIYGKDAKDQGFVVVEKDELDMIDNFFSDPASKSWEIITVGEAKRRKSICSFCEDDTEDLLPVLVDDSVVLESCHVEQLAPNLPARTQGYQWRLAYSTAVHGTSLKTLYRNLAPVDSPVLLVVKDMDNQIFGALTSHPFKISDHYYGTGETFLFSFSPDLKIFRWSGENFYFIKGDTEFLELGGGNGYFGLWLDVDLYHGRSNPCSTFNNETLSKKEDFLVKELEVWTFE